MFRIMRRHGEVLIHYGQLNNHLKPYKCQRALHLDSFFFTTKYEQRTLSILNRQFSGSGKHGSPVSSMASERHQDLDSDLKSDAMTIFKSAVNSVRPRKMIENVLQYDESSSTLMVEDKIYNLNRNVFVVGFGKATLGMARAVEDTIGEHIVSGIISIPRGLPKEMAEAQQFDSLLCETSKIQTYEGSYANQVDEAAYNAAKAITSLVTNLTEKDIVIVLCSGGGSVLLPAPQHPITLNDLLELSRLLAFQGISMKDLNTVRKNIESLKGGGLVTAAKPAKVIGLVLSSIIGDMVDIMAGGPTYPCQPTPHHCSQILERLAVKDKVPATVTAFLDKAIREVNLSQSNDKVRQMAKTELEQHWKRVQNVVVGNNSLACEAASKKATELGYLPLIITKEFSGEARKIGSVIAKLARFIMICYDRKVSLEVNSTLAQLEVDLVATGLKKQWINNVRVHTDMAHYLNKDLCIISSGEMVVHVTGTGIGGKNMECALGAVNQFKNDLFGADVMDSETKMAFLSADTDGHDGVTKIAGAVIDNDFVAHMVEKDYDIDHFLEKNDSLALFQVANSGHNLIETKLTGTNVNDIVILLVKRPRD